MADSLIVFNPTQLEVEDVTLKSAEDLKTACLLLTTNGIEDKETYDLIHKERMKIKGIRTAIKARRKEITEDALKFQKDAIAYEKKLLEPLDIAFDHLEAEEKKVDEEKQRIKDEKIEKEKQRVLVIEKRIIEAGYSWAPPVYKCGEDFLSGDDLANLTEEKILEMESFGAAYKKRLADEEAERARLAKEQEEKEAAEKAQFEKDQAELKKKQEEIEEREQAQREREAAIEKKEQELIEAQREADKALAEKVVQIPSNFPPRPDLNKEEITHDCGILLEVGEDMKAGQTACVSSEDGKLYIHNS